MRARPTVRHIACLDYPVSGPEVAKLTWSKPNISEVPMRPNARSQNALKFQEDGSEVLYWRHDGLTFNRAYFGFPSD